MTQTELAEAIFVAMHCHRETICEDEEVNAKRAFVAAKAFLLYAQVNRPPTEATTPRATIRTVLWALNKLKAAPGQPNRDLVRKFLYMKNWIGHVETPEDWNLDHVPTTQEAIIQLVSDVREFDIAQHKPVTPEP